MKKCPKCGYVRQVSDVPPEFPEHECPSCGIIYAKFVQTAALRKATNTNGPTQVQTDDQSPLLTKVFSMLAALSFIGGVYIAYKMWPDAKELGPNETYRFIAYSGAMIWLTAGIVQTALFAAMGQIIMYLSKIVKNTSREKE